MKASILALVALLLPACISFNVACKGKADQKQESKILSDGVVDTKANIKAKAKVDTTGEDLGKATRAATTGGF